MIEKSENEQLETKQPGDIITSLEQAMNNIEGLRQNARLRREDALQRALMALRRLEGSSREINFRTVGSEAGVSTAFLYNQQELRGRIMRLRKSRNWKSSAATDRADSDGISKKSVIATLRLRIKKLEERNRQLSERLEHAYAVIAETGQLVPSTTSG